MSSSRLFAGYRALGFVSNEVPLCTRYHKQNDTNYIITCVGRAFHVYNADNLGIKSVSDSLPEAITCLKVDHDYVFAAAGNLIYAFMQGRKIKRVYEGHKSQVRMLLPLADLLISVDKSSSVKVWNIKTAELFLDIPNDVQTFEVTALMRPYDDKVLFGSKSGQMKLYKIRENKVLYSFDRNWNSNITVLQLTTATDVVAVGLGDGRIILHNILYDEEVMSFRQEWGEVTSIAFRTDIEMMLSGSPDGRIAAWDLNEKVFHSAVNSHSGPVTGMTCLPKEAIMISSSSDNSIKRWRFDDTGGRMRLDGERSGFSSQAQKVRFHGTDGRIVIASGCDGTLRRFSTVHDSENRNFGCVEQENSRLTRDNFITEFVSETARQSDWDSILAIHRFEKVATTWSYNKPKLGKYKLLHKRFKDAQTHRRTEATCLSVTSCGNFGLVGYSSGHLDVFNLQSGHHRGSFGKEKAHEGKVTGVCVNTVNTMVVSAGKDGVLNFWEFPKNLKPPRLIKQLELESCANVMLLHRDSGMLALACDDLSVVVVDIETKRVVRQFTGPANEITDMTFTADGRKLIVSSLDSKVRTWDLVSERLIDCFIVEPPVTSVTMSPTDTFLATTHVDDVGVYLWSNRTLYSGMVAAPLVESHDAALMNLPSTSGPRRGDPKLNDDGTANETSAFQSPAQIEDLLTVTDLPKARWHSLFHLEAIKERNKLKEAPKAPKNAPFFIPTIAGVDFQFLKPETANAPDNGNRKFLSSGILTQFGRLTETAAEETDPEKKEELYAKMLDHLKKCGPSVTEDEFQSTNLVGHLLDFIQHVLKTKKEFNLMLTYVATLLKLHRELIFIDPELLGKVSEILSNHREELDELFSARRKSLCLTTFIKGAAI